MPANPTHHTATVDTPWDGPAQEAKLATPVTKARGNGMYAWHDAQGNDPDADGYPDAKADSKFPHHEVDAEGNPGAANLAGCRNGMSRIPQADIPPADDAGVRAHLQAHMDDGEPGEPNEPGEGDEPMGLTQGASLVSPRAYTHVTKALYERPWAIQPSMLSLMVNLLQLRTSGDRLGPDEIAERLAAAQAQNGERLGGYQVGSVAVLPMYGLISQRVSMMSDMSGGTSVDELRQALRSALADRTVSAVVFDIDSPGGSVDGVPEFAAEIRSARQGSKPIIGQINTLCASAAYWIGSQMSELVMTVSGEVGSIGVYAAHEDQSGAEQMAGVKTTLISAGPYKVDGNPFEPLTDTARAAIQDQVDEFYGMFVSDVARGRRTNADNVAANYGQGRTLLARKALAAGMVDRIDSLEATVTRAQQPKAQAGRVAALSLPLESAARAAAVSRPDQNWNRRMKGKLR